jgi:hypothetical protein
VSYRFKGEVHDLLFRKYSLLAAKAYDAGLGGGSLRGDNETHLDALTQYYNAFEHYPKRAESYLDAARDFEEPLIPGSKGSYSLEEGRVRKDAALVKEAIAEFNPTWERDMIADAYTELAMWGSRSEKADAAERLYALNRGMLPQKGVRLPALLEFRGFDAATVRALGKAARSAGIAELRNSDARYTLRFESAASKGTISVELYDNGRGASLYHGAIPLSGTGTRKSGGSWARFSRALQEGLFKAF